MKRPVCGRRFRRTNKILTSVLCAALAMLTAAQSTAAPYKLAYAAQTGDDSSAADEDTNTVGGEVLDDALGETILYRWEKFNGNNYPKDNDWHPLLIIWGASRSKIMNPAAPGDIYLEDSHTVIAGANWFGRDGNGNFPLSHYNDDRFGPYTGTAANVDPIGAAALKLHDTANYSEIRNNCTKDVFYTTGDYNCMFARYMGIENITQCPYFTLSPSSGLNKDSASPNMLKSDFVINLPNGNGYRGSSKGRASGQMKLTVGDARVNGYEDIVFQTQSDGLCKIFDSNAEYSNVQLVSQDGYAIGEADFKGLDKAVSQFTAEAETAAIYFGTLYRYSAIKEDTTIGSGQILSITKSKYLDTKGKEQSQDGVLLPPGKTLTIEKGGILSVEGDFINNGTIINNGGTILIKKNGTIFPFRNSTGIAENGCGTIKCLGGDIIIKEGGALYAGLNDEFGFFVPFNVDEGSTIINQGLMVYGSMRLGKGTTLELYDNSVTLGSWYTTELEQMNIPASFFDSFTEQQKKDYYATLDKLGFNYELNESTGVLSVIQMKPVEQADMLSKYNEQFLKIKSFQTNDSIAVGVMRNAHQKFVVSSRFGASSATKSSSEYSDEEKPHWYVSDKAKQNDFQSDKTSFVWEKLSI